MKLDKFKDWINRPESEEEAWTYIQALRALVQPLRLDRVKAESRDEALLGGLSMIRLALKRVQESGLDFSGVEPGHGPGHLIRDYVNGLLLFKELEADYGSIMLGLAAAALHDVGLVFVPRYEDAHRAIRHAEAGALIIQRLLPHQMADSLGYCVAAHTHYLGDSEVKCRDGAVRKLTPYPDTMDNGKPYWPAWFTRWPDRLECNGPAFVARHYLTVLEEHKDYGEGGFYEVKFRPHLRPLLRSNDEIKAAGDGRTMLEHLNMFASSQSNSSPYGRHDYGRMVEFRDAYRGRLESVIDAVHLDFIGEHHRYARGEGELTEDGAIIQDAWKSFLGKNICPTERGRDQAKKLDREFGQLPIKHRSAWCAGFLVCMREYCDWASWVLKELETLPSEFYKLPGICGDVREAIRPDPSWTEMIGRISE